MNVLSAQCRDSIAPELWVMAKLWADLAPNGSLPSKSRFFARDPRTTSAALPSALLAGLKAEDNSIVLVFVGTDLADRFDIRAFEVNGYDTGARRILSLVELIALAAESGRPKLAEGRDQRRGSRASELLQVAVFPFDDDGAQTLLACFAFSGRFVYGEPAATSELVIESHQEL